MEQPLERLEVQWQKVDSVRAVTALGMQRMRDVAMSCSVLKLLPRDTAGFDPIVFLEHSLGCALVCRQFARKIGFSEPGKAYLAGLLHDIGIIAHLWVAPAEFRATMERASAEHITLHEAEQAVLGITHAESGRIVAERWHARSSASGGLPPRRCQSHHRTSAGSSRLTQRLAVPDGRLGIRVHRRSSGEFSGRAWIRHSRKRMRQAGQL